MLEIGKTVLQFILNEITNLCIVVAVFYGIDHRRWAEHS